MVKLCITWPLKAEADRRHQKFLYQGATGKKTCQVGGRSGLDQGPVVCFFFFSAGFFFWGSQGGVQLLFDLIGGIVLGH